MAYEYEKIIGYIDDLIEGDGSEKMAKYIDCPHCAAPLTIVVHSDDKSIHISCPRDQSHMSWDGYYDALPVWIHKYKELNI